MENKEEKTRKKRSTPARTTVNLGDLIHRIEKLRDDSAWKALSLPQKIRLLLEEYVALLEEQKKRAQKKEDEPPQTLAALVQQHFFVLQKANIKNIMAIAEGGKATHADVIRICSVLNLDQSFVQQLADKVVTQEEKNGCTELSQ